MVKKSWLIVFSVFYSMLSIMCMSSEPYKDAYVQVNMSETNISEIIPLIQYDADSFLTWVRKDLATPPSSTARKTIVKALGVGIGVTGCCVFYNLGQDLAKEILDNKGFTVTTGIASAVPIAILGSQFCKHIFSEIVSKESEESINITENTGCIKWLAVRSAQGLVSVLAIISAAPVTYLTNKYYFPLIGYGAIALDVPSFVSKAVCDFWALDATASMFFNMARNQYLRKKYNLRPDDTTYMRFKLIDHLEQSSRMLTSMSDEAVKDIYDSLISSNESNLVGDRQLQKIFLNHHTLAFELTQENCSWGRKFAGSLGSVVGAFSSACLVPLAEESMTSFFQSIHIYSPALNKVGGWIAGLTAGSLITYASKESFENFYDFFASLPQYCKSDNASKRQITRRDVARVAISSASLVLAVYSSAPQAFISEKYFGTETPLQLFTLACAALGPFTMNFWAIDSFFSGILMPQGPREKMNYVLQRIKEKIPTMQESVIIDLYAKTQKISINN